MLDREDLQAIANLLQPIHVRLDKVDARLDNIENRLTAVEENTETTRSAVNILLDWAERAQVQVQIPLFKKAE